MSPTPSQKGSKRSRPPTVKIHGLVISITAMDPSPISRPSSTTWLNQPKRWPGTGGYSYRSVPSFSFQVTGRSRTQPLLRCNARRQLDLKRTLTSTIAKVPHHRQASRHGRLPYEVNHDALVFPAASAAGES